MMQHIDCHISLLLDRSGSMDSIRDDIIGGVNRFWDDQKSTGLMITASMIQFDSQDPFECLIENRPIAEVAHLSRDSYQPRGQTPLLDAMGRAIYSLDRHIETLAEANRPSRVVFVVVTDGQENASREFTHAQIGDLIVAREKSGWQVDFLSSDLSAITEVSGLVPSESKAIKTYYARRSDLHLGLGKASDRIMALLRTDLESD